LFPIVGFQIVTSSLFQALGKPVQGTILSLSRQILFFIPLLIILPLFWGLDGIFMTFPISDICSAVLAAVIVRFEIKHLKGLIKEQKAHLAAVV
jgi:Na+-driven multidrug efflux pump